MLQYKIPQDVQIEDKILGPLTLKQLLMVALGGGLSYGIFLVMSKSYYLGIFDYFWIVIPLILSLAFAFIKINDVSFLKWLMLLYEYGHNSRRRRWDKTETGRLHFAFVTAKTAEAKPEQKNLPKKASIPGKKKFSSLEELTYMLDHSSNVMNEEQAAPDDHGEDYALHLSGTEKDRHEERLEQIMKTSSQPITSSLNIPVKISDSVMLAVPSPVAKNVENIVAPVPPAPIEAQTSNTAPTQEKAVDMIHSSDSTPGHEIRFEDLMKGGQISFS